MGSLLSHCCIPPVYFGLFVLFFFLIYLAFTHQKKKDV